MIEIKNLIDRCLWMAIDERRRSPSKIRMVIVHRISFAGDTGRNKFGKRYWKGIKAIPDHDLGAFEVRQRFGDTRRYLASRKPHFADRPGAATGGRMPYELILRTNGILEQALPITHYGAHAIAYNPISIGLAIVGDFNNNRLGALQHHTLIQFLGACKAIGWDIFSHTETGQSVDPDKKCPGSKINMDAIRRSALGIAANLGSPKAGMDILADAGLKGLIVPA